jgi:hypothetical protein
MLRFDCAWPRDSASAEAILETSEPRTVHLRTSVRIPTFARWASFGWAVTECFDKHGNTIPMPDFARSAP